MNTTSRASSRTYGLDLVLDGFERAVQPTRR